ncbi:MAG: phosphomannomutase, phosphomannomutase [Candidatus Saccharibacteria bacterium]|nr:phosphomannomutase, phosphomannomutase [Candidatus Saccharibacteria bacterium]
MSEETFTAYDIRGKVTEGVSLEVAWNIGKALADWLSTYGVVAVVRGNGGNEALTHALVEGMTLQGRDVLDAGAGDKSSLLERIKHDGLSGGIFVAHDTQDDVCVIELYDENAQLISAENGLNTIAELVHAGNFVPAATKGELTSIA